MIHKVDIFVDFVHFMIHNKHMKQNPQLLIPAKAALVKLGADLKRARLRRRISTLLMAERASISRTTLARLEKGDPRVAMGHYAMVMGLLGFCPFLRDVADSSHDPAAEFTDDDHLPRRVN